MGALSRRALFLFAWELNHFIPPSVHPCIHPCRGRFYILAGYLLSEEAPPHFDDHLNMQLLGSALSTLQSICMQSSGVGGDECASYQILYHLVKTARQVPQLHNGDFVGMSFIFKLEVRCCMVL